jgi:hypothetical protein
MTDVRRPFLGALTALLSVALACTSTVEPPVGITLSVTNATCVAGRCDSLRILGFPDNQPATPGGLWSLDLGLLTTTRACVTLPPSAEFHVIGVRDDGTADTVTFRWTSGDPISLGAQPPATPRPLASPDTPAFVPAGAAGWQVTLPAASAPTPASACAS